MARVTVKTSTIFISVGDTTQVFRSVEDVPPSLRKRLEDSTNGINSATILIADRRGREEIVKAIRGLPSVVKSRLAPQAGAAKSEIAPIPVRPLSVRLADNWMELVTPAAIGVLVLLLFRIA